MQILLCLHCSLIIGSVGLMICSLIHSDLPAPIGASTSILNSTQNPQHTTVLLRMGIHGLVLKDHDETVD